MTSKPIGLTEDGKLPARALQAVAEASEVRGMVSEVAVTRDNVMTARRISTLKNGTSVLAESTVPFGKVSAAVAKTITVSDLPMGNTFAGVGAALTPSSAYALKLYMTKAQRLAMFREDFAPGNGFSWLRIALGGTDFSFLPHTSYAETAYGTTTAAVAAGATSLTTTIPFAVGDELIIDANPFGQTSTFSSIGDSSIQVTVPSGGGLRFVTGDPISIGVANRYMANTVTTVSSSGNVWTIGLSAPLVMTHQIGTVVVAHGDLRREVRTVTAVSGSASPYTVTLGSALSKAHPTGVRVTKRDASLSAYRFHTEYAVLIDILKEILSVNPDVHLTGAVWVPPTWMKRTLSGAAGQLEPSEIPTLAKYIAKLVQSFSDAGIRFEHVCPQNEPGDPSGSLTYYLAADFATTARALRSELDALGFAEVGILGHDGQWEQTKYAQDVLTAAREVIDVIGWHSYNDLPPAQLPVKRGWPGVPQMITEKRSLLAEDWLATVKIMACDLIVGCLRYGGQGSIAWNYALDQDGNPTQGSTGRRGVVIVNNDRSGTVTRFADWYSLMHAAKYVRLGARVLVDSNTAAVGRVAPDVQTVSFRNPDGSKVTYIVNPHPTDAKTIQIVDGRANRAVTLTVQSGEVTTLIWGETSNSTLVVPDVAPDPTPNPPAAAPTVVAFTGAKDSTNLANELTYSVTVPAGIQNGYVVVWVAGGDGPDGATAGVWATVDGAPMRLLGYARSVSGANVRWMQLWGLPIGASSGAKQVVARANFRTRILSEAAVLAGANQDDPARPFRDFSGTSAGSVSVATPAGVSAATDLVLAGFVGRTTAAITIGAGLTEIGHQEASNIWMTATRQPGGTAALSTTFTFTPQTSPDVAAAVAVALRGAPA